MLSMDPRIATQLMDLLIISSNVVPVRVVKLRETVCSVSKKLPTSAVSKMTGIETSVSVLNSMAIMR